jgi:hypothetical protein
MNFCGLFLSLFIFNFQYFSGEREGRIGRKEEWKIPWNILKFLGKHQDNSLYDGFDSIEVC